MSRNKILFIEEVNKFFDNLSKGIKSLEKITDVKTRLEEATKLEKEAWNKWNNKIYFAYSQYRGSDDELGSWQTADLGFENLTGRIGLNSNPYLSLKNLITKTRNEVKNDKKAPSGSGNNKPTKKEKNHWGQSVRENLNYFVENVKDFANYLIGNKKTQFVCDQCNQVNSGQYWYPKGREEKFCSEQCFNLWKNKILEEIELAKKELEQAQRKKEQSERKLKAITEYPCDGGCGQKLNLAYDDTYYKDVSNKKGYLCKLCHKKRNICSECKGPGQVYNHKTKNDGKSFCSSTCFNKHYAPVCDECSQKVSGDSYYNDYENKTGTLCPKCYARRQETNALVEENKRLKRESNSQQEITNLADKSNKTPRERQDLAEEPFYKNPLVIGAIGIGALGLLGLIIFFINKSKKDRE